MKYLLILFLSIPLFAVNKTDLRYNYNTFTKKCSVNSDVDTASVMYEVSKNRMMLDKQYNMNGGRVTILVIKYKNSEIKKLYTNTLSSCESIKNIMDYK